MVQKEYFAGRHSFCYIAETCYPGWQESLHKLAKLVEQLAAVYQFCQTNDYEGVISGFYLLYWAWDDLGWGNEKQYYWPEATQENIKAVVMETANKWLAKYYVCYAQNSIVVRSPGH